MEPVAATEDDAVKAVERDALFSEFSGPDFDVRTHASRILQGVAVSQQLAKLSGGIQSLDILLHEHVCSHHQDLLAQATGIGRLEAILAMMQSHLQCLLSSVERLRGKVVEPYNKIRSQTLMLARLQQACEMLRRVGRVMYLSKRLQGIGAGAGAGELAKAASALHELDQLCADVDLSGVQVTEADQRAAKQKRGQVEGQVQLMLAQGLRDRNHAQAGAALQVYYNLDSLERTVESVVHKMVEDIRTGVRDGLDLQKMESRPFGPGGAAAAAPGRAAIPTPGSSAILRQTLWSNLERVMDMVYSYTAQAHLLQKCLGNDDQSTRAPFSSRLKNPDVLASFWERVGIAIASEFKRASDGSGFMKQTLQVEYPKLLRMYSSLWDRIKSLNSDATESDSHTLRAALAPFEEAYLSRSLSHMLDPVHRMFSPHSLPTKDETEAVIRTVTSELSVSQSDPLLHARVCENVNQAVRLFATRCESSLLKESDASQVIGPPTQAQLVNAGVANLLWGFHGSLSRAANTEQISSVLALLPDLVRVSMQPLLSSVSDAIEAIILTMHNEDFSGPLKQEGSGKPDSPCSLYMRELQGFISRVSSDYLSLFLCQDIVYECVCPLASRCVELFVRHASLVRPLGEGGRMRLAADFAQMDLAVSPLCRRTSADLGQSYRLLRAFKPLLFLTTQHVLETPAVQSGLIPSSLAIHHLFARAPPALKSPHQRASWSLSRYSHWLDEHTGERERLSLIKGALEAYVKEVKQREGTEFADVYPVMLKLIQMGLQ